MLYWIFDCKTGVAVNFTEYANDKQLALEDWMRKVHIDNIVPGTRVAKSVFTSDGRELLASGIGIKENYIERLRKSGITEIFIEDEVSYGIDVADVVHENTRLEAKRLVKSLMEDGPFSQALNVKEVREIILRIIGELLSIGDIIVNLSEIRSVDDYTFEHSVNVCILSIITGIGLGFDKRCLKDLGVGAILHDIGKMRIPDEILKKPSQLTVEEFEEIKKHTVYGYEILKKLPNVSVISSLIAFGHHERYDGSGYPLQLRGENISLYARIVAIADVYDALTSDRVYRKKLRPHEVIEYIASLGAYHFDKEILECFIKYMAIYPKGTGVLLSTNERAIVVQLNVNMPTRPVVRVIYDQSQVTLKNYYEIDLSKEMNISIIDACEF